MKITAAILLIVLSCSSFAQARIGETLDQIINRYGEGQKQVGSRLPGTERYDFNKGGFAIEVIVFNGKTVMEVFNHHGGPMITDEEIQNLLKINSEEHNWALDRRTNQWLRSDGKLAAYREPGHPDFFFIEDIEAAKQARSKNGKAALDGF